MLYIKCPTCNRLLADKMVAYEAALDKLGASESVTSSLDVAKMAILDSLKIPKDRYCCRMRIMTYRRLITIVK